MKQDAGRWVEAAGGRGGGGKGRRRQNRERNPCCVGVAEEMYTCLSLSHE